MDYYYIHATTQHDESKTWNGATFISGHEKVDDPKQYDTLEQALDALDKAMQVARKMGMQVIMIDKAEALIDKPGFKFETIVWERVE